MSRKQKREFMQFWVDIMGWEHDLVRWVAHS